MTGLHPFGLAPWRRLALLALLQCALVLPGLGAAVAELTGAQQIVICRGDKLVTILVSGDGTPIEAEEATVAPCLPASLPQGGPGAPDRVISLAPLQPDHIQQAQVPPQRPGASPNPARGPPA